MGPARLPSEEPGPPEGYLGLANEDESVNREQNEEVPMNRKNAWMLAVVIMWTVVAQGAGRDGVFSITDYGAVPDGKTDNTAAIQKALDVCMVAGGGTVRVAGGAFMTYTLYPRSNTRLEIEAGASLEGGPDPLKYPLFDTNDNWRVEFSLRRNRRALIYAVAQTNLAICGRGLINGHAEYFHVPTDGHWWRRKDDQLLTGRCLFLVGCRDVLLENFRMLNPTGWSMWLLDCERVSICGLNIDMNLKYPNGDGIHIGSCRDVTVSDCIVRSSDDALILRAYQHQLAKPMPCERITVNNCVLQSNSAGVRIGWTHDYEVRDCRLSNLVIRESHTGIIIALPTTKNVPNDPPRGPDVPPLPDPAPFALENVHFSGVSMDVRGDAFLMEFGQDAKIRCVRDLTFSDMTVRAPCYPRFRLRPGDNVSDIVFRDVRWELKEGGKGAFELRGVERLTLDHVTFTER